MCDDFMAKNKAKLFYEWDFWKKKNIENKKTQILIPMNHV